MGNLWIFKLAIGSFAIPILMIGLRGVVTKRPFLVSDRLIIGIMSISALLSVTALPFIACGGLFFDEPFSAFNVGSVGGNDFSFKFVGIILLIAFLIVFFLPLGIAFFALRDQTDGYSAFGVTDESFQEALHSALNKLNLPFEETIFRLRLTSTGADLQAVVQSAMGIGQLTIKPSEHRPILKNIADAMNEYFTKTSGKLNVAASIYSIIMGALALIAAWVF